MARAKRFTPGGFVYHVCNRGSRKGELFGSYEEYDFFVELLNEARGKRRMRIIAYCVMKTHVHLLLWPVGDGEVARFMHWLTTKHANSWHRWRNSVGTGAVYQSRYVSVPIADGRHYFTALRYVERNAAEASLVDRAEQWPWGSASQIVAASPTFVLDDGPFERPANWLDVLNGP
jgi:REP-associated tyrosine transposase